MKRSPTYLVFLLVCIIHVTRPANAAAVNEVTTAQSAVINDVGTVTTASASMQSSTTIAKSAAASESSTVISSTTTTTTPAASAAQSPSLRQSSSFVSMLTGAATSGPSIVPPSSQYPSLISANSAAASSAVAVSVTAQKQPSSSPSGSLASGAGGFSAQSALPTFPTSVPASVPASIIPAAGSATSGGSMPSSVNPSLATMASAISSTFGAASSTSLSQQGSFSNALSSSSAASSSFASKISASVSTISSTTISSSTRPLRFTPARSSSFTSISSSTSTSAATTTSPPRTCSPVWSNTTNVSSLRSVRYLWYTSASACLDACASGAIPNCVAVDVDYTNPSFVACLAHVNASDLDVQFNTSGTTQHRLVSGCQRQTVACANSTWVALSGTQSVGAQLYTQYTALADCQSACLKTVPNCVAIDFASESQCWLYTDASKLLPTIPSSYVTQYRIADRCPGQGTCTPVWTSQWYTSSLGAVQRPDVQTVSGCQSLCVSTAGCVAIDYSNTLFCWLHLDQSSLRTTVVQGDVTQYRLVSVCP